MGKREGAVGSDRNRIPPSVDMPPLEREPAPEAGGYEAPAPKKDPADIVDH
jgi:hypothetical protein